MNAETALATLKVISAAFAAGSAGGLGRHWHLMHRNWSSSSRRSQKSRLAEMGVSVALGCIVGGFGGLALSMGIGQLNGPMLMVICFAIGYKGSEASGVFSAILKSILR